MTDQSGLLLPDISLSGVCGPLANIHPEYDLWHYVRKLLRLQVVISFSAFRRAKARRKIGYIFLFVFFAGLLGGAFAASWFMLQFLRSPQLAQMTELAPFLAGLPVLIVAAAFLGILLTSFGVLLQALYLAGDMDFLLSAPMPMRAVFVAKLLQAILPNFSLICLFGLPVLFGLGASSGYTVLYYPLVVIVLAALALAAAGLSSLLVMGVVRLFPARRVAEVLSFAGGIISVLCSQSNYLSRHVSVSEQQTAQTLDMLARLNSPWSPLAWAGRGLVDIGEGRWLSGFLFLGLTLGTAGVIFVIALNTAEQLYYTGWANVQIGTRRKKISVSRPATEKRSAFTTLLERDVPGAVRGIISKDFLMLRRDLRNMSQLVSPLIFGVIYAVLLARSGGEPPQGRGQAPAWFMLAMKNMLVYGNVGISLFVGWSLLSRLALMGFSQEGKHYWLLKTAPVSASKLLIAKFLVAYLPTLILGWGFLLAISLAQGVNLTGLIFGMAVVALCIAGAAGVNLAFGAVGANLDWQDPRQMMPGALGCLGAIASFGYMLVTLGLFFAPPIILAMLGLSEAIGQVIGLAAGGAVSLVCAVIPPLLVRQRVARIGET